MQCCCCTTCLHCTSWRSWCRHQQCCCNESALACHSPLVHVQSVPSRWKLVSAVHCDLCGPAASLLLLQPSPAYCGPHNQLSMYPVVQPASQTSCAPMVFTTKTDFAAHMWCGCCTREISFRVASFRLDNFCTCSSRTRQLEEAPQLLHMHSITNLSFTRPWLQHMQCAASCFKWML